MYLVSAYHPLVSGAINFCTTIATVDFYLPYLWNGLRPELLHLAGEYITPFMNRTGIVFRVCILASIIVSLMTKPVPKKELEGLIWNKESLTLPKEMKARMKGLRNPAIWWALVTIVLLFMYIKYR